MPPYNEKELINKIAKSLVKPILEYRKARQVNDAMQTNTESATMTIDDLLKNNSRFKGEYTHIERSDYWLDIITAKIEVINEIGGFALMQKICAEFEGYPENSEYHLVDAFDHAADGIGDWRM